MGRLSESLKYSTIVEASSRNRSDILEAIAGREIPPHKIEIRDRSHLVWHTTPTALEDEAKRLRGLHDRHQGLGVNSTGELLYLTRGNRSVNIRKGVRGHDIKMSVQPSVLLEVAEKLATARWEKPKPGYVFGSDRRIVDRRFGYNIVTFSWTPEADRNGVPQISPMDWAVFSEVQQEAFRQETEEADKWFHTMVPPDMVRIPKKNL